MSKASKRTSPGKLANQRTNARESAVLAHFGRQTQKVSYDVESDGGEDQSFGVQLPANSVITAVHTFVDTVNDKTAGTATLTIGSFTQDIEAELKSAGYSEVAITAATVGTSSAEITLDVDQTDATAGKARIMVEFLNTDPINS